MVKLIDLLFISIPEAFAISYFIWFLVGRSSYIDHKKIAFAALASATALSASFEAIDSLAIKTTYQLVIMIVVYYLFYNLRISQTLISILSIFTVCMVSQLLGNLFVSEVLKLERYFNDSGIWLNELLCKYIVLNFEIVIFILGILILAYFRFNLSATTVRKEYKHIDLSKFIVSVFSILFLIIPDFRILDSTNISLTFDLLYVVVNTLIYAIIVAIIANDYMVNYLKSRDIVTIQKYQLDNLKEKQKLHDELLENSDKVIELDFKDKK